jgi:hypothetical protein
VVQGIAHVHGDDCRHVAVGEIGQELADYEQQKDERAQAGERLRDGVNAIDRASDCPSSDAIGRANRQKHQHDLHDQAAHEG